jgi:hypothetical protein
MKLTGTIRDVSTLSAREQMTMFSLMRSHYTNVKREKFLTDLAEKDGVLLLSSGTGVIQGFTTFMLMEFAFRNQPVYTTKGIKTYLLLPLFFKRFYPNCRTETPLETRELMESLAYRKFGEFYHKEQGIVRVVPRADSLQEQFASIPEHKRKNPHVRHFTAHNPGYTEGDELVCLARISASNFTPKAQRFVKLKQQ